MSFKNFIAESKRIIIKGSNVQINFDPDIPNVVFIPPQSGVVEFGSVEEVNAVIKVLNKLKKEM